MQHLTYLVKPSNTRYYSFRIIVPQPLRKAIGKRGIRRSLRTSEYLPALRQAQQLATYYKEFFKQQRKGTMSKKESTIPVASSEEVLEHLQTLDKKTLEEPATEEIHTVSQLIDVYIRSKENSGKWSEESTKGFTNEYRIFIETFGDQDLLRITHADGERYVEKLQATIRSQHGKPLSTRTINNRITNLCSLFASGVETERAPRNPFTRLHLKEESRDDENRDSFTSEDIQKLFNPSTFEKESSRVRRVNYAHLMPLTEPYVRASYTAPVCSPSSETEIPVCTASMS